MSDSNLEAWLFSAHPRRRGFWIALSFVIIGLLDFWTPPQYVLAYLYALPILASISFVQPWLSQTLLILGLTATVINLFFPVNAASPDYFLRDPSVVINRMLAAGAIMVSAFLMERYLRYHTRLQAQTTQLHSERQLTELRENFSATLTHDLKTPMLGTRQSLTYVLEGSFGVLSPQQRQVLETVHRSNQRQLDLVETLMVLYRYEAIGLKLALSWVDMDELIADMIMECQPLASQHAVTLAYGCSHSPPRIQADAMQIKRVVANLLHNAVQVSPDEGQVEIQLVEQADTLKIEVRDQGRGLSVEDQQNLFNRFYRSSQRQRHQISTGLGLYLSQQIVKAHHGEIGAENLENGQGIHGCRFYFTLPLSLHPFQEGDSA